MQQLPEALKPLADYRQFILYKLVPRDDKLDKLPVDHRTLQVFVKDDGWQEDQAAWTDATTALNLLAMCGDNYGLGFFFTKNDPFYFLDIDKCLQADGSWSPTAMALLGMLNGAAVEVSASGTGLHVFGTGQCPQHSCRNRDLGLELYTERRFVALTGINTVGSASFNNAINLPTLVNNYFPASTAIINPIAWTTEPVGEWSGSKDDNKLLEKMLASKSDKAKMGYAACFADLWTRDIPVLSDMFAPDASDTGEYDESTADAALAQHLAFWTGNNCERMLTLMNKSALVRDKWVKHKDYLRNTIIKAVSMQTKFYNDGKKKKEPPRVSVNAQSVTAIRTTPAIMTDYQFLGVNQQIEHFKGCMYVQHLHKVLTPTGEILKSEQFNATYGGYVFQLEANTSGKTTRKAWEAFTESQAIRYPIATTTCFRPLLEAGVLLHEGERTLVNTYIPITTPSNPGDAEPFLNHMLKVIPVENDRAILLAYMAACVQHKGDKFQWAPLIQGVEGNGKTLFSRCVEAAIGERYTHMPPADQIAEKFNAWLFDKLFIGVEDIYVPEHRNEVIEILKPMITARRLSKRDMGVGQHMQDVCANFIFNSNHKDAVRKTQNDRRFAIFYTAQQCKADLADSGMDGGYFPRLYSWLEKCGGYAIVTNYLENYIIPVELNPALNAGGYAINAPVTSSTDEAIEESLGPIEQEVLEAISEGRIGFRGGWVSSIALNKLLEETRYKISIKRRRMLLQSLGYEWHPGLIKGQVNNIIPTDGGKPRLYLKNDHLSRNLNTCAAIVEAYEQAQGTVLPVISPVVNAVK